MLSSVTAADLRRDAPAHSAVRALADLVGRPELGGLQHAVEAAAERQALRRLAA